MDIEMRRPPILAAVALMAIIAGLLSSNGVASGKDPPPSIRWLAAGDSYSSGEGVEKTEGECQQAPADAWAGKARVQLSDVLTVTDANFNFVACSGATKNDPSNSQGPAFTENAWSSQQFQAYYSGGQYDLITLTFGGNDLRFYKKIKECIGLNGTFGSAATGAVVGAQGGPVVAAGTAVTSAAAYWLQHRCSFTLDSLASA